MFNEVGLYRGSFDPPHLGHYEAVDYALKNGINQVIVIFKDANRFKPFRTTNKIRKFLLRQMFCELQNVTISKKSYKITLAELMADPTIAKIHHIMGSDLLNSRARPLALPTKLCYFFIPRVGYPIEKSMNVWNNLPAQVGDPSQFHEQHNSSSKIRDCLYERDFLEAKAGLSSNIFESICAQKFFLLTDTEYSYRDMLKEVKKTIEEEIVKNNIASEEFYPLSFHLGNDLGITGLSGDLICFIKDKNANVVLVVKIFKGEHFKKNYDSEILGYQTIAKLNLKLVTTPKLFFSHQKEGYAFIGMSFITGQPLAEIMHENLAAVQLCARANLELHLAKRSYVKEGWEEGLTIFENAIKNVADELQTIPFSTFLPSDIIERITERWRQIHKSFILNPGLLSFTHGDPNHYNWIVDMDKMTVNYIDFSLFERSFFNDQTPRGFAINELEESLLTIWIALKRKGIANEEIFAIQEAYRNEYMKHAPEDITTPEAKVYFSSYWELRVTLSVLDKLKKAKLPADILKYQSQIVSKINQFITENPKSM